MGSGPSPRALTSWPTCVPSNAPWERLSAEQLYHMGQLADQRFSKLLRKQGCEPFAHRWSRQRRRAIRRWPGLLGLRHRSREQRRSIVRHGRLQPLKLSDLSDAINILVDAELNPSASTPVASCIPVPILARP